MTKYGYTSKRQLIPESVDQLLLEERDTFTPNAGASSKYIKLSQSVAASRLDETIMNRNFQHTFSQQKVTIKDGKRRIQPILVQDGNVNVFVNHILTDKS
jgi:hypothetical protein